jgi:hypothetical protein
MWMLILEAGVALFLLLLIVWWTMFSGKKPDHGMQQDTASSESDVTQKNR